MDHVAIKHAFEEDGFVKISNFLSKKQSQELQSKLDQFIETVVPTMPKEHVFFEDQDNKSTLKQLFHLSKYDTYFEQLVQGSEFEKLAEILLGEKMAKRQVEYFNKPPGVGKATPPHQDNYYFKLSPPQALTFWIPLENVNEENGCLRYLKKSHLNGMRSHGKTTTLGFSQGIVDYGTGDDPSNEVAMPVNVGDILVHHSMTVHRADQNKSTTRSRRVLGLVYFGETAIEDTITKEAYQKTLFEKEK